MKRWLAKLVVFLLLGLVVNVAVAWGCACWSDLGEMRLPHDQTNAMIGLGYTQYASTRTFTGEYFTSVYPISAEAGWPVRCVVRETHITEFELRVIGGPRLKGPGPSPLKYGWNVSEALPWFPCRAGRLIPLHPIWPGFAINTVFYAALLWLLTLGPFTARRMIRRRHGRCIKCGYDLRHAEHEVCPECGAGCDGV